MLNPHKDAASGQVLTLINPANMCCFKSIPSPWMPLFLFHSTNASYVTNSTPFPQSLLPYSLNFHSWTLCRTDVQQFIMLSVLILQLEVACRLANSSAPFPREDSHRNLHTCLESDLPTCLLEGPKPEVLVTGLHTWQWSGGTIRQADIQVTRGSGTKGARKQAALRR